ncbi:MAG: hypothetical protein AAB921_03500 [Patescibacteria group bacterium]
MTGPEGGFYSHNTFRVENDIPRNKQEAEASVVTSGPFKEFSPEGLALLEHGPMNKVHWFTNFNHPDLAFLTTEDMALITKYVEQTDTTKRNDMEEAVIAVVEKASDAAYKEELKNAA